MKIERVTFIWTCMFTMDFEQPEMSKKWTLYFLGPTCLSSDYFIHILYVKVVLE